MDSDGAKFAQAGLSRRPGQRSGCSCCSSFMVIGLVALPALAAAVVYVARWI
ncbi:MAG: hypothetical protein ACJ78Q_08725 [Chloroflexia bacterium]